MRQHEERASVQRERQKTEGRAARRKGSFALCVSEHCLDESATGRRPYIVHTHPHRFSDLSPYCTTQRKYDGFFFPNITVVKKKVRHGLTRKCK